MSDKLPLNKQIALIECVVSNAKRVGTVYNLSRANSVAIVTKLKGLLSAQGMTLVESVALRAVDIAPTARNLIGKIGVVYTNTDNNVVSVYELLVKVASEAKTPLVVGDTDSVKYGATAALSINYYKPGQQTGKVVARILKGKKPGAIASAGSSNLELFVNKDTAKK